MLSSSALGLTSTLNQNTFSTNHRSSHSGVFAEQTSNLLPVKELAVVGTVVVFVGNTYFVPEWLRHRLQARLRLGLGRGGSGGGTATDQATGAHSP